MTETTVSPLPEDGRPGARVWGEAAFVWIVWGLLTVSCLVYVARFGSNVPYMDEWDTVVCAIATGQDLTPNFLWAQHNENRSPLPKLVWVLLERLGHYDFRIGMYASVFVLAAAAALLVRTAGRVRGWYSYPDVLLALGLLHLGQCENLLMSTQLQFTLPVLLMAVLYTVMMTTHSELGMRRALTAALAVNGLPLCGATGLAVTPGFAIWLAWTGLRQARKPAGRTGGWLALGGAAAACVLLILYFRGFNWNGQVARESSVAAIAWGAAQCLAISAGTGACGIDVLGREVPGAIHTGLHQWQFVAGIMLGFLLASATVLIRTWMRRPEERTRCLALGLFACAVAVVAPIIGWGRSQLAPYAGLSMRYLVICLPLWWVIYGIWPLTRWRNFGGVMQMALFGFFCSIFLSNEGAGLRFGRDRRDAMRKFEQTLDAGAPAPLLANDCEFLYPIPEMLIEKFSLLRRAGIGSFKRLSEPAYDEVHLPVTAALIEHLVGTPGHWHAEGAASAAVFRLPSRCFVDAVRVRLKVCNGGGAATVRCSWSDSAQSAPLAEHARAKAYWTPSGSRCLTFPVGERLDQLRISPDLRSCDWDLQEVVLLCSGANHAVARANTKRSAH